MSASPTTAAAFRPLRNKVFVTDLESGSRMTRGGLIIPDDNMKDRGIHARWGRVYAIGEDIRGISIGEWVLIEHGRWTNGIDLDLPGGAVRVWHIDWPDAVLIASPTNPAAEHQV